MIGQIRLFARLLASQPLTVDDVVQHVGPIIENPGSPIPMQLQPTSLFIRSASLAVDRWTGCPYTLELRPHPEYRPTLGDLSDEFGPFVEVRADRGQPKACVFDRILRGDGCSVSILAEMSPTASDVSEARIDALTLRRDLGASRGSNDDREGGTS